MSPPVVRRWQGLSRFPRVSGDEPEALLSLGFDEVFSPRERG